MEAVTTLFVTFALSLAAALLFLFNDRLTHGRPKKATDKEFPPGPPAVVFLAKFIALPRPIFHIGSLVRQLHARHGPVISVRLFRTFVFVGNRRLAHRVLVQEGANFADRPPAVEPWRLFFSGGINTSTYGPYWQLVSRNLAAKMLHPERVRLFAPARRHGLDVLVLALGGDGSVTLRPLLRRVMFELLVYMSLGARLGAEILHETQELHLRIFRSITSFPVFSFFPALTKRLLFRKRWAGYVAMSERRDEIFRPLIQARRAAPAPQGAGAEEEPMCYADSLLALRVPEEGDRPLTDGEVVSLCSEFLMAAMDSTLCALEWTMAELVNHPAVQAKVYEYEEVRGRPELSQRDLRETPYLKAVVLEALRLHPAGQLIVPHSVRRDAQIGGYMVPKGADVNFLVADFGLDEKVWTAAREFRPERFLDGGEGCDVDITGSREIKMIPFGAGRRMCPGFMLGMLHLEYFVGSLVREFQWLPETEGEDVDMTEELNSTTDMKHSLRARVIPRLIPVKLTSSS